jgi:hypothetical protein
MTEEKCLCRSTASGLPALFKKRGDALKEVDVEMGETQDLLEKKPQDGEEVQIFYYSLRYRQ